MALNTFSPDDECGPLLSAALLSGTLDFEKTWTCPQCSAEWRVREYRGHDEVFRHWEPYCPVMIFHAYDP